MCMDVHVCLGRGGRGRPLTFVGQFVLPWASHLLLQGGTVERNSHAASCGRSGTNVVYKRNEYNYSKPNSTFIRNYYRWSTYRPAA